MDPKEQKQNLSTSSEISTSSLSKMNPKKKKQKLSTLDLNKQKKKQKVSELQVIIASPSLSKEELRVAMRKQNNVAMTLTGKVIAIKARNSNFVFSPASINAVLTMAAAESGSISDELKAVFSEIATVVFADGSANGGPKITSINGFWVEQSLPVDHSLKDLLVNFFKATFAQVDFRFKAEQVRGELNKWASDHTNGLIKEVLPPASVTSKTERVYGNALYFKGAWETPFDKKYTKDNKFHLLNGKQVDVPFMKSYKRQYIGAYNGFKVLRLPYRQRQSHDDDDDDGCEYSMCFFLPDKKEGLENIVEEMTSTTGFLDNYIPRHTVAVGDLRIPKFKISFMFDASKDFDDLVSVSVYHKAFVEINEEGAEAAAATFGMAFGGARLRPPPKRIDFVADHPFLFLIREDKTGTILFAGQIFDPSKSS